MKDLDGRYLFVNAAWSNLFSTSSVDVNGKTDLELFPKNIAARFMDNDRQTLKSAMPLDAEEVVLLDNRMHYYQSTKFSICDGDGKAYGLCGITADDQAVIAKGEVLKIDEDLNGRSYNTIKFPIVQGVKTLLAGLTIDVTERKQAEIERQNMENSFSTPRNLRASGSLPAA